MSYVVKRLPKLKDFKRELEEFPERIKYYNKYGGYIGSSESMNYLEYKELRKDLVNKLQALNRGAYSYLGVNLDALREYEKQTDKERTELIEKIRKCELEMKKIEEIVGE